VKVRATAAETLKRAIQSGTKFLLLENSDQVQYERVKAGLEDKDIVFKPTSATIVSALESLCGNIWARIKDKAEKPKHYACVETRFVETKPIFYAVCQFADKGWSFWLALHRSGASNNTY
jgi:hypothetical protein